MHPMNRRRFLHASALGAAALGTGPAQAAGADEKQRPRFRLGLVTYNLAAAWKLDDLLRVCKAVGISPVVGNIWPKFTERIN